MLAKLPMPSALIRTTESHFTSGPMGGVPRVKRGVPSPRSIPMRNRPPTACVGAMGPAILLNKTTRSPATVTWCASTGHI